MMNMQIEVVLIAAIIIFQFFLAFRTYRGISKLKGILEFDEFPNVIVGNVPVSVANEGISEVVESYIKAKDSTHRNTEAVQITMISATSDNAIDKRILNTINTYLVRNKGAIADYHLLKDIVDREVQTLDDEIQNELPAPLYLGLAATMLGIIFGLMNIPDSSAQNDFNIMAALQPLLFGVKTAMLSSLAGLALTTTLSIGLYRFAKSVSEERKNNFLSFLQANLLPELVRTETSGVSALNDRLRNFGRNLAPAIASLSEIVDRSLSSVKQQQEVVVRVGMLDVNRLTKANVAMFNKISEMMDSFDQFAIYYNELNRSMVQTVEMTSTLKEFATRTKNFETIAKEIQNTLQQNKDLNQFLASHLIDVKSREEALRNLVDSSERNLKSTFDQMVSVVQERIHAVQNLAVAMEPEVKNVFASAVQSFQQMTSEQVDKIESAFQASRPQFEKLDKLEKIEIGISTLTNQGQAAIEKQVILIQALRDLASIVSNNGGNQADKGNVKVNAALLSELENINLTLSRESAKRRKFNRLRAVVLVTATGGVLSLLGVAIYALLNGHIIFW